MSVKLFKLLPPTAVIGTAAISCAFQEGYTGLAKDTLTEQGLQAAE